MEVNELVQGMKLIADELAELDKDPFQDVCERCVWYNIVIGKQRLR